MKRQNCSCLLADDGWWRFSLDVSTASWQEAPGLQSILHGEPSKDHLPKPISVALLPQILFLFIFLPPISLLLLRFFLCQPLNQWGFSEFLPQPTCLHVWSDLVWSMSSAPIPRRWPLSLYLQLLPLS